MTVLKSTSSKAWHLIFDTGVSGFRVPQELRDDIVVQIKTNDQVANVTCSGTEIRVTVDLDKLPGPNREVAMKELERKIKAIIRRVVTDAKKASMPDPVALESTRV